MRNHVDIYSITYPSRRKHWRICPFRSFLGRYMFLWGVPTVSRHSTEHLVKCTCQELVMMGFFVGVFFFWLELLCFLLFGQSSLRAYATLCFSHYLSHLSSWTYLLFQNFFPSYCSSVPWAKEITYGPLFFANSKVISVTEAVA